MDSQTQAHGLNRRRNGHTTWYGGLRDHVERVVGRLQFELLNDYSASVRSNALGSLARLRRAVGSRPGDDPLVWREVFDGLPQAFVGKDTEPSPEERAVHDALTLYAVHQQSRQQPMHIEEISFGRAAAHLALKLGGGAVRSEAVTRRFQLIGTASSHAETVHHARSLINQFRAEKISLGYGLLAVDLARLTKTETAGAVRLQWGRDFYFSRPTTVDSSDSSTPDTPNNTTSPEETEEATS